MKCKLCGADITYMKDYDTMSLCFDCWKTADCCGLEKL